jgi:hypothetical protein
VDTLIDYIILVKMPAVPFLPVMSFRAPSAVLPEHYALTKQGCVTILSVNQVEPDASIFLEAPAGKKSTAVPNTFYKPTGAPKPKL